jgi:AcrR family transcriptional regulator
MTTATTRRRATAIARTREDILEAAARAFTRAGYHSATMKDIAAEAGYTAASLYTYFESKDEILRDLMHKVVEDFLQVFGEPVPAGLTFLQKVELLLTRHLTLAERRRDLFRVLLGVATSVECTMAAAKGSRDPHWPMEVQVGRLADWFRANAGPRDLGGHRPEDAARFIVGFTDSFMHAWMTEGAKAGALTERIGLILDLFFHGLSGRRGPDRNGGHKP